MRETEIIFRSTIEEVRKKLIHTDINGTYIRIDDLKRLSPTGIYTFELLSPYGFHEAVISDILHSADEGSGKIFYSQTHRLIKNREQLIIHPITDKKGSRVKNAEITIPMNKKEIRKPIHLSFTKTSCGKTFSIDPSDNVANLDLNKIKFPLIVKRWEKGDSFYPLGMNKKKKLSDYFIDHKLSIPEKENIWLLCSGSQILWIIGHRIDHRFRITSRTKEVLQVTWIAEK
jgi:tRNA(Ile)-lysidine synthase